ncbi:hypothetical protein Tco_0032526 [Tanacetum coccineum]
MLLNIDQLQKKLDKDEFQEDGSMTAFWVVNNQFQKFIDSKFALDYDSQMTDTYFVEYTRIKVQHFRDTLLQHLGNVKKSFAERTRHQRQTDSTVQDDNSRSGNDTDADDANIRPIYDKEPMAEVQLTAVCNIFAIGQQHIEQPEIINEGKVDQNSSKNMPRFSSNDMVHNHYLDVAKKKIQERDRNSKRTSVTTSARIQTTADESKPKPGSNNQTSRSLPISKSSHVMITAMPK